jgi:sulfide dehydrogenase cytochrome subunit
MAYKITRILLLVSGLLFTTAIWASTDNLPLMLVNDCIVCHGFQGSSLGPATPSIAGMDKEDFVETMETYKKDEIPSTIMGRIAKGYTRADFQVMAKYFSKQELIRYRQEVNTDKARQGAVLHKEFCEKCHKNNGYSFGDEGASILAGQWMPYLRFNLTDFHANMREMPKKMKNRMEKMVKIHGKESLEVIIHFYGSLTEQK